MTSPFPHTPVPAPAPAPRRRRWPWLLAIAAAFVVGIGAGQAGHTTQDSRLAAQPVAATKTVTAAPRTEMVAAPAVTQTVTSAPEPPPVTTSAPPAGPATSFGNGQYQVGVDIAAGQYKSSGPTDGSMCYVEVARDDLGSIDSIVNNDIVQGPKTVTVKKGQYVKNSGCETFTKVR